MRPLLRTEVLTRIAQCGTTHVVRMQLQEPGQQTPVDAFAHLTQHPAHRFLRQITTIVEDGPRARELSTRRPA